MKTLVYQSFRTQDVPDWITVCMNSVDVWRKHHGYSYEFIDDRFFNIVPMEFRTRVDNQRHLVSDIARLEFARKYLQEGWDRVIWVDADMMIFDPVNFKIDDNEKYLFSRELWMTQMDDQLHFSNRVNNSVTVFCKDNHFLDFYRSACYSIVANKQVKLAHTDIGTGFLTRLIDVLPQIQTSIVLSPLLLRALYIEDTDMVSAFLNRKNAPLHAANLCLTFRNMKFNDLLITDETFIKVIHQLAGISKASSG